eukprot:763072-Hanusia_phi.AAC.3
MGADVCLEQCALLRTLPGNTSSGAWSRWTCEQGVGFRRRESCGVGEEVRGSQASLQTPRMCLAVAALNSKIIAAGGWDGSRDLKVVETYDGSRQATQGSRKLSDVALQVGERSVADCSSIELCHRHLRLKSGRVRRCELLAIDDTAVVPSTYNSRLLCRQHTTQRLACDVQSKGLH